MTPPHQAVAVLAALLMLDLLHARQKVRLLVQRGLELLHVRLAPKVVHQGLVMHPVSRGAS